MLLNFILDNDSFRILNPAEIEFATSVNYIKCHFNIKASDWQDVDAIAAIFKSATYNKYYEVMLDSNNNCYVDPEVYKRGGTVQVKLAADKYLSDSIHSTTHMTSILEFKVNEAISVPTRIPSTHDVFVAEFERVAQSIEDALDDLATRLANHEFDGERGVGIESASFSPTGYLTLLFSDGESTTSNISLIGPQGPQGIQGIQGIQGPQGPRGPQGDTYVLTDADRTAIANNVKVLISPYVSDVIVDNESIVTDGVAGIDKIDFLSTGISNSAESYQWITIRTIKPDGSVQSHGSVARTTLASSSGRGLMSNTDKIKLDSLSITNGVVDSSSLPSYVNNVIEAYPISGESELTNTWLSASSGGTALTPESGKIYILMADSDTYTANTLFRWSGTVYVAVGGIGDGSSSGPNIYTSPTAPGSEDGENGDIWLIYEE